MRHHPRGLPHEFADRSGQVRATGTAGLLSMTGFIVSHGIDDGATAHIAFGEQVEMAPQVTFDLAFGLGDEAQTGPITQQRGQGSDPEGSRVPKWIEQARPAAELVQSRLAPGEMIGFLAGGLEHEIPNFRPASKHGLGVIQRLRGHLAGVVDSHQGRRLALFIRGQRRIGIFLGFAGRGGGRGDRASGGGWRQQGAQGPVGGRDEGIQIGSPSHWARV